MKRRFHPASTPRIPDPVRIEHFVAMDLPKGNIAAQHESVRYSLRSPPGPAKLIWSSLKGLRPPESGR